MEDIKRPNKVISIYSNTVTHGKAEYAINLTAAIAKLTNDKVLLINMSMQS